MTERELSELEEAVGSWTTKEQKRVLRELRKALGQAAGWYAEAYELRRKVKLYERHFEPFKEA